MGQLPGDAHTDAVELAGRLARAVEGEVRFDGGSRALYAQGAGNYRQVPIGGVIPRSLDDVLATLAICRSFGAPVLSRGGGTSLAGQEGNVAGVPHPSKDLRPLRAGGPKRRAGPRA